MELNYSRIVFVFSLSILLFLVLGALSVNRLKRETNYVNQLNKLKKLELKQGLVSAHLSSLIFVSVVELTLMISKLLFKDISAEIIVLHAVLVMFHLKTIRTNEYRQRLSSTRILLVIYQTAVAVILVYVQNISDGLFIGIALTMIFAQYMLNKYAFLKENRI